jgi:hypothetical protein
MLAVKVFLLLFLISRIPPRCFLFAHSNLFLPLAHSHHHRFVLFLLMQNQRCSGGRGEKCERFFSRIAKFFVQQHYNSSCMFSSFGSMTFESSSRLQTAVGIFQIFTLAVIRYVTKLLRAI